MMFKYSSYPPIGYETTFCLDCGLHTPSSIDLDSNIYTFAPDTWRRSTSLHNLPISANHASTEQCAVLYFKTQRISTPCTVCTKALVNINSFNFIPNLFVLHLGSQKMIISHTIVAPFSERSYTYKLRGMIYFGSAHFTSQYVDQNEDVWYHDGIETVHTCQSQGALCNMTNDSLLFARSRQLCTVIYSLQ